MTAIEAIKLAGQAIIEEKDFLTDLDQAIGDGDHGINMARGFSSVFTKIDALKDDADISMVLKTVGMGLISSVGGASGPLYGTAFLRASAACKDKNAIDAVTAKEMLDAAIKGIQDRGKAVKGEKTMLDALIPASEAIGTGIDAGKNVVECLKDAVEAAQTGVEYTKTIIATKGRASYLAERSIGHQDPGATSSTTMLKALYEYVK
ncbi:dihydroxyacetone kinase subunit DhaL [Pectinatus brassicae]|uniref:phosphoenolpyruvate--glycerone phosphotransferase n=1 Tax=Pectinatus brassicae TaxID=862415 RepID=A0A840UQY8_9FIRM|nr:dihydroxyacetone kinase subunit DhaL [Pectinatus brassicae]MBB5335413.1 dihydroxyacetone kinase-like protein [Pectinatus brassicae]